MNIDPPHESDRRVENILQWAIEPPPHDLSAEEILREALPGIEITAFVGKGGMGRVYRGIQQALDRPVAIKFLHQDATDAQQPTEERLRREGQFMARLQHPHIVGVYDAGVSRDGDFYVVMEWIEGIDLSAWMEKNGIPPWQTAIDWIIQASKGLSFAHSQGIFHRDIKPSNLLLTHDGKIKVADFGLAHSNNSGESRLTSPLHCWGTACYIAPELQESGNTPNERSDLFSLAVTLYELLTGKPPRGNFPLASEIHASLPAVYDDILMRALSTAPEHRQRSLDEFASALTKPKLDTILSRRRLRLMQLAAAGFITMSGISFYIFQQHKDLQRATELAAEQRREAEKLIDYLVNQMMWQIPEKHEDLQKFQPMLDHLDQYFDHFDKPTTADADFLYAKATFHQVKALYARSIGNQKLANELFHSLPAARDRHLAAAGSLHDTAIANAGQARTMLGDWLMFDMNKPDEAMKCYREGENLLRDHLDKSPSMYGTRMILAELLCKIANAMWTNGDTENGATLLHESASILAELRQSDPHQNKLPQLSALTQAELGSLYESLGQWDLALQHFTTMSQLYEQMLTQNAEIPQRSRLRMKYDIGIRIGSVLAKKGDDSGAKAEFSTAIEALETHLTRHPDDSDIRTLADDLKARRELISTP